MTTLDRSGNDATSGGLGTWWARNRQHWRVSMGRHATDEDEIELVQRRIFVLPTQRGLFLIFTAILLLLVGINYQLSLAYVVAFLLGGFMQAALLTSYRNLRGLIVRAGRSPQCAAGERLEFAVSLRSPGRARDGIRLSVKHGNAVITVKPTLIPADTPTSLSLSVPTLTRGVYALGRIALETRAPYGVIRAWSYAHFEWIGLVEPKPEQPAPALPLTRIDDDAAKASGEPVAHDPDTLREYVAGDSLKRVAWKQVAKSGAWYTRTSDAGAGARREIELSWASTENSDPEDKLSRLTAWVLRAHNEGVAYALNMPNGNLAMADGAQQQRDALQLLAAYPHRPETLSGLR